MITRHNPAGLYPKYPGYSHAVEVGSGGRMLFVSGLNGYLVDGKTMPESFEGQCRTIWGHLATILGSANMTYKNLVFLRTYLASGSLAAALLTAWGEGDPAQAQARMLAAVNNFHAPKQAADDQSPAQQN